MQPGHLRMLVSAQLQVSKGKAGVLSCMLQVKHQARRLDPRSEHRSPPRNHYRVLLARKSLLHLEFLRKVLSAKQVVARDIAIYTGSTVPTASSVETRC